MQTVSTTKQLFTDVGATWSVTSQSKEGWCVLIQSKFLTKMFVCVVTCGNSSEFCSLCAWEIVFCVAHLAEKFDGWSSDMCSVLVNYNLLVAYVNYKKCVTIKYDVQNLRWAKKWVPKNWLAI